MTDHIIEAPGQLTAALQNSDGTQNIYITSDPAVNALTLTLRNGLANAITFPPGKPAEYGKLADGQSAVYIFPDGLIDNAEVAAITLSTPGWAMGTFTDPTSTFQYLVLAPVSQVSVPAAGTLSFKFGNVLVAGAQRSGTADIELAGATGVTSDEAVVSLLLNIANPPQPGNKQLDVNVKIDFDVPVVYTVPSQSLVLHLVNKEQAPLVPGGTDSWKGVTPTFQLTLVYGASAGSLTTVAKAKNIAVTISNDYCNVWQPVQRYLQGDSPYWIMQPNPNGGGTVLGTGDQATIQFLASGIDATLPDKLDSAITVAYVTWHSVPGYDDGCTTLIITKNAGPKVNLFTANPASVAFGQPSVQTVLTWDAAHATGVYFEAPQVNPAQPFMPSGSGPIDGGINVPRNTTVTVTAYKDISSDRVVQPGERAGLPGDIITATASLLFTGTTRTDVPVGIGSLGGIVIPSDSARAFLFQMNSGRVSSSELTHAAVLDLKTHAVTSTLDLKSLIPSKGAGTLINAAVASPDGTVIHVLASSGVGASNLTPEYYLLPLNVASATYGKPVDVGTFVPSGAPFRPTLIATPDGRTVYISAVYFQTGASYFCAFDAVGYAAKGSWNWQPAPAQKEFWPAIAYASNADGSKLLIGGWGGLVTFEVGGSFAEIAVLDITKQLKLTATPPVVSPDGTRAYLLGLSNLQAPNCSLIVADIDPTTGALSLVKVIQLGLIPPSLAGLLTLSPDARTLYVLTDKDVMTAFDTTTFAAVPHTCGINGDFAPVVIATGQAQPTLVYATGNNGYTNGTFSIVTFA